MAKWEIVDHWEVGMFGGYGFMGVRQVGMEMYIEM